MGIPSYFSYIVKNHSNIIKKLTTKQLFPINNLYLDCNSIIYDAAHSLKFDNLTNYDANANLIISCVLRKIDEHISLIQPDNFVFIAFDGVAPMAKLAQQRERRYKSLYQNQISKTIFNDSSATDPWNTTAITPGTHFMSMLNTQIKEYYKDPAKYGIKSFIVSASDRFGEGEHKLFDFIRHNPKYHTDLTTVIYGLDADLIMLCINHLPICKNIYLFRETPHFIQSINSSLEPNETYLLDIPELARVIADDMNNGLPQEVNRTYDYIFLCFFLGNDFMPHFPSVNIRTGGINKMLNAYKATIGGTTEILTDGKTIYWKNVKKLVQHLAKSEEDHLKSEMKLRDKRSQQFYPSDTPENKLKKFEAIPTYERQLEKSINPFKPKWQERYYKALFKVEIDDTRRAQISINYLEGLEWTMKYYTSGCPNWQWSYKYNYPPLLEDLIEFIPSLDTVLMENVPPNPISPLVQLCYVLPKQSLTLLPEPLYNALMSEHPEWYNTNCDFVWAFCRYFWESHVELPEIDITELAEFVKINITH